MDQIKFNIVHRKVNGKNDLQIYLVSKSNQKHHMATAQYFITVASLYTIVTSFLSIKYYFQQTHCDKHCEHVLCWYPRIEIGVTSAVRILGLKSKLYSMSIKL